MRTEITVHGAKPVMYRSGTTLWLMVPLIPPPGALEPTPAATLFFDNPATAVALGRDLIREGEVALELARVERDAGRTRQEVAG